MPDNFASFTDPTTGQPMLVPQAQAPSGTPYRVSEGIGPNGMTASGDVFNPFRGYVSPDGGGFGEKAPTQQGILSILGGQPGQYDALAGRLAQNPDAYKAFQGILNHDKGAMTAAAQGGDADLAKIGQDYLSREFPSGPSSEHQATGQDQAYRDALAASQDAQAPVDTDPYGRNDSPTSPAHTLINSATGRAALRTPVALPSTRMSITDTPNATPSTPDTPTRTTAPMANQGDNFTPFQNAGVQFAPSMANAVSGFNPNTPAQDAGGGVPTPDQTDFGGPMQIDGPTIQNPTPFQAYGGGEQPATSPMGMTARGGYPGMMGRRFAMAGLNRFRRPGGSGMQMGQAAPQGFLGGAGGAGAGQQY